MKKALFILIALVMVGSGVAAVSAYEAHLINVTAHVENALAVNTDAVGFGTVFPEEWIKQHRSITLSDSAIASLGVAPGTLKEVEYKIFAEWKPVPAGVTVTPVVVGTDGKNYYAWLGKALYVGIDPTQTPKNVDGMVVVGPAVAGPPSAQLVAGVAGKLDTNNRSDLLGIGIDVPVFAGSYNALTDMLQADGTYLPKPSGLDDPTWIIPADFPGYDPDGMDFGLDLKVQVTKITRN